MKNLADEYKNQIDNDFASIMPDLWSKIEAEVDAIEAAKKDNNDNVTVVSSNDTADKKIDRVNENVVSFESAANKDNVRNISDAAPKKKKKTKTSTYKWLSGIAISAAAVLIVIPTLIYFGRDGMKTVESSTASDYEAPACDNFADSFAGECAVADEPASETPVGDAGTTDHKLGSAVENGIKIEESDDYINDAVDCESEEAMEGFIDISGKPFEGKVESMAETVSGYYAEIVDEEGNSYCASVSDKNREVLETLCDENGKAIFTLQVLEDTITSEDGPVYVVLKIETE